MSISNLVCGMAVGQLVKGACETLGVHAGVAAGQQVADLLHRHFTDHSQKLLKVLHESHDQAWKTLELALAGDGVFDRLARVLVSTDKKAFGEQMKAILAQARWDRLPDTDLTRCATELRAVRRSGLLKFEAELPKIADAAAGLARFTEPNRLVDRSWQQVEAVAEVVDSAGHASLGRLLRFRPAEDAEPLLASAARYYFRRAIERDAELYRGLSFARLETIHQDQSAAWADLRSLVTEHAEIVDRQLDELLELAKETHASVLDIQNEQRQIGARNEEIYNAVLGLQKKLDLMQREVRPRDSLSIRSDVERRLIHEVVARYRGMPEVTRTALPALANAVGKLQVAAGDFQDAQATFGDVVRMVGEDPAAMGQAHFNAWRAALERRDWGNALRSLLEAVRCDPKAFVPFPMGKYSPQRILGAGGFGVAFLCRHKYMDAKIVVKTLGEDYGDGDLETVFAEARALAELSHPSIVRISDCGYVDPARRSRPFIVMDYFEGPTLDEYVEKFGTIAVADFFPLAKMIASGLLAAHRRDILHRDVKPANVLVKFEDDIWDIRLIDFGLAIRRRTDADTSVHRKTLVGASIAGTLHYAAPEQMGQLGDTPVGPQADVYGFARTCCFALFGTPQPTLKHWQSIPKPLAELLDRCLSENPKQRPSGFNAVLEQLQQVGRIGSSSTMPVALVRHDDIRKPAPTSRPTEELELEEEPPIRSRQRQRQSQSQSQTRRVAPRRLDRYENEKRGSLKWMIWTGSGLFALLVVSLAVIFWPSSRPTQPAPPNGWTVDASGGVVYTDPLANAGIPGMPPQMGNGFVGANGNATIPQMPIRFPVTPPPEVAKVDPPVPPKYASIDRAPAGKLMLSELKEDRALSGNAEVPVSKRGKIVDNGAFEKGSQWISIDGKPAPESISMMPGRRASYSSITFSLKKRATRLVTAAGFDDRKPPSWAVGFEVLGDGRPLFIYESKDNTTTRACDVDLTGVDILEFRTTAKVSNRDSFAVWVDPYILVAAPGEAVAVEKPPTTVADPVVKTPANDPPAKDTDIVWLCDLKEVNFQDGRWTISKNGKLGNPEDPNKWISVDSKPSPHGICIYPANGKTSAAGLTFQIDGKYTRFESKVAIDDSGGRSIFKPTATFTVFGGANQKTQKSLFKSQTLGGPGRVIDIDLDIRGMNFLTIQVSNNDSFSDGMYGIWFEPKLRK